VWKPPVAFLRESPGTYAVPRFVRLIETGQFNAKALATATYPLDRARRGDFHLAEFACQGLAGDAVPAVSAVGSGRVVLLIAEMLFHLGLHCTFHYRLGELLQKDVDILWLPALFQQPVDQLVADWFLLLLPFHAVLLLLPENVYTVFKTPSYHKVLLPLSAFLGAFGHTTPHAVAPATDFVRFRMRIRL